MFIRAPQDNPLIDFTDQSFKTGTIEGLETFKRKNLQGEHLATIYRFAMEQPGDTSWIRGEHGSRHRQCITLQRGTEANTLYVKVLRPDKSGIYEGITLLLSNYEKRPCVCQEVTIQQSDPKASLPPFMAEDEFSPMLTGLRESLSKNNDRFLEAAMICLLDFTDEIRVGTHS